MNILHIIGSIDPQTGGTAEAMRLMAQAMHRLGHRIEVATLDAQTYFDHTTVTYDGPIHWLGGPKRSQYAYSPLAKTWLSDNASNYDAVIIHGLWQYHSFVASRICRRLGVPYYMFPHGMLDPWFNTTYPLKRIKKLCYWFWGENPGLRHATAVCFTTEEERQLARKSFPWYQVNEAVVGLGTERPESDIDALLTEFNHNRPQWAQRPYFLFMSRIQEKKGLDLLVAAYANLRRSSPDLPELVIAGPIQQAGYAERIQQDFSQEGIHWIGTLNATEKWPALAAAEAMVLISHQENFGIVIAESLLAGTPVLISNKINIWREVATTQAGLVETDTLEGAKRLLSQWLACTTDQRKHMSHQSKAAFATHFEITQSTQRLLQVIESNRQTSQ